MQSSSNSSSSLLFIDANVVNYQNLVQKVNPETKVIVLNAQEDGIKQLLMRITVLA